MEGLAHFLANVIKKLTRSISLLTYKLTLEAGIMLFIPFPHQLVEILVSKRVDTVLGSGRGFQRPLGWLSTRGSKEVRYFNSP